MDDPKDLAEAEVEIDFDPKPESEPWQHAAETPQRAPATDVIPRGLEVDTEPGAFAPGLSPAEDAPAAALDEVTLSFDVEEASVGVEPLPGTPSGVGDVAEPNAAVSLHDVAMSQDIAVDVSFDDPAAPGGPRGEATPATTPPHSESVSSAEQTPPVALADSLDDLPAPAFEVQVPGTFGEQASEAAGASTSEDATLDSITDPMALESVATTPELAFPAPSEESPLPAVAAAGADDGEVAPLAGTQPEAAEWHVTPEPHAERWPPEEHPLTSPTGENSTAVEALQANAGPGPFPAAAGDVGTADTLPEHPAPEVASVDTLAPFAGDEPDAVERRAVPTEPTVVRQTFGSEIVDLQASEARPEMETTFEFPDETPASSALDDLEPEPEPEPEIETAWGDVPADVGLHFQDSEVRPQGGPDTEVGAVDEALDLTAGIDGETSGGSPPAVGAEPEPEPEWVTMPTEETDSDLDAFDEEGSADAGAHAVKGRDGVADGQSEVTELETSAAELPTVLGSKVAPPVAGEPSPATEPRETAKRESDPSLDVDAFLADLMGDAAPGAKNEAKPGTDNDPPVSERGAKTEPVAKASTPASVAPSAENTPERAGAPASEQDTVRADPSMDADDRNAGTEGRQVSRTSPSRAETLRRALAGEPYDPQALPDARTLVVGLARAWVASGHDAEALVTALLGAVETTTATPQSEES